MVNLYWIDWMGNFNFPLNGDEKNHREKKFVERINLIPIDNEIPDNQFGTMNANFLSYKFLFISSSFFFNVKFM